MISSTFKATGCLLFIFCISVCAQTPAKKTAPGTISGKVTLKGQGLAGILVGVRNKETDRQSKPGLTVTTDSEGNYRIANVPPGTYEIMPGSPQFVLAGGKERKSLIVNEGETLDGIDFALVRGGVITGRLIDSEGRPVIEENVSITNPDGALSESFVSLSVAYSPTDDRGVYRIYGLPPGKYRVSAGAADDRLYYDATGRNHYKRTFHPSTTDPDKATLIEVSEGSEAANVDITFRKPQPTFIISGKVVDGDTGEPIPNVVYGLQKNFKNGSQSNSGMITTPKGEFRFESVTPGSYAVFILSSPTLEIYGEPVSFEVTDQNVTGLIIKASSGNTISGVVVVDGMDEKTARTAIDKAVILVESQNAAERNRDYRRPNAMVNPDGSFRVTGTPGLLEFMIFTDNRGGRACEIIRIERNGVVQTGRIELKDREQINDLRLVVRFHSGSIQGIVKFENGELLPNQRVQVMVTGLGDQQFQSSLDLDARGRFSLSGLKPGDYEIQVAAYLQGTFSRRTPMTKQQVIVVDNKVSEVTLTLDLGVKN